MKEPLPRQGERLVGEDRIWIVSSVEWPDLEPPAALVRSEMDLSEGSTITYAVAYFADPTSETVQSLARLTGVSSVALLDQSRSTSELNWVALADDTATWRFHQYVNLFIKDEALLALEADDLGWIPDRGLARLHSVRHVPPSIRSTYAPPSPATRQPEGPNGLPFWVLRAVVSESSEARNSLLLDDPEPSNAHRLILDCSGHAPDCPRLAERIDYLSDRADLHSLGSRIVTFVNPVQQHAFELASELDAIGFQLKTERDTQVQRLSVTGRCRCHRASHSQGRPLHVQLAAQRLNVPVDDIVKLDEACTPFGLLVMADALALLHDCDAELAANALRQTDAAPLLAKWQFVRVGTRSGTQSSLIPLAIALGLCTKFKTQIGSDSIRSNFLVDLVMEQLQEESRLPHHGAQSSDPASPQVLARFLGSEAIIPDKLRSLLSLSY